MPNGTVAPGYVCPWPPVPINTSTNCVNPFVSLAEPLALPNSPTVQCGLPATASPDNAAVWTNFLLVTFLDISLAPLHSNRFQQFRPLFAQAHNQFPKQRIRPREPCPHELRRIILVKRLVHESC